ncbi:MAG: proprotein convertase P-domain-containing protein, partial [Pirellula sp.]
ANVFGDSNSDGLIDAGEAPLPEKTIYWDYNNNGVLDPPSSSNPGSGTINMLVPDLSTQWSDLLVAGMSGTLEDVNLKLNISMSFDADLRAFLIHPDGTRVELFTEVGGSRDNFSETLFDDQADRSIVQGVPPFTGSFRPEGSLTALNGKSPNGVWRLELTDIAASFQATLKNWELALRSSEKTGVTSRFGSHYFDLQGGAQSIRVMPPSGWIFTQPSDGARSATPIGLPLFGQSYGMKAPPTLSIDQANVVGVEGVSLTNSGTWSDLDTQSVNVTLDASIGAIIKNANGTWSWSFMSTDQQPTTQVTVTANDGTGSSASVQFHFVVNNSPPTISRSAASINGNVLTTVFNTGAFSDVPSDTVSLAASLGSIEQNANGTWSWSFVPPSRYVNHIVTITASDEDGGTSTTSFTFDALVAITRYQAYYRGSDYQTLGGVNAAIDSSKSFLRASTGNQNAGPSIIINYSLGINGVVLDIAGLPSANLSVSDFIFRASPTGTGGVVTPSSWLAAPTPLSIDVISGSLISPARVLIQWENNAIQNRWLQIIVKANGNTGLVDREVYYLGHALAEADFSTPYRVTAADLSLIQSAISNNIVAISNLRDFNKDRRVSSADLSLVQSRISNTILLNNITVPPKNSLAEGESFDVCLPYPAPQPNDIGSRMHGSQPDTVDESKAWRPTAGPHSTTTPQHDDYVIDDSLRFDEEGLAYFHDDAVMESEPDLFKVDGSNSMDQASNARDSKVGDGLPTKMDEPSPLEVPAYHSNPSYTKKIYLDFDGEMVSGTTWNNRNYTGSYNTGSVINAPAFSLDADRTTFSSAEMSAIFDTFVRIAEDFAPFQVDVTTEYPGASLFTAGGQAIRVMISTDTDATTGSQWYPNAGGVAYINSWNWTNGSPVWVFANRLGGSSKNFGEAGSHEVGHSFGLSHDGRISPTEEYYGGHGSGATGWAPIMGVGYSRSLTQWSKGEYASANNSEDDLLQISNAIAY